MREAGFKLRDQPGLWFSEEGIEVDLLVPEAIAGGGRRAARLGAPHGDRTAMKVRGLEGVLIDNEPRSIGALEASDNREFEIAVAGPAALLVSKLHKIVERADTPSRSMDKDALDVLRILRGTSTDDLSSSIRRLRVKSCLQLEKLPGRANLSSCKRLRVTGRLIYHTRAGKSVRT